MKRVFEVAKELKISVSKLKTILTHLNIPFQSHMTKLTDEYVKQIRDYFFNKKDYAKIKLLILDVDGVLSDNKIIYDSAGNELKSFSPKDGLGIRLLSFTDITPAIITGRKSEMVERRAKDLGIEYIFQKVKNKLKTASSLLEELGLNWENVAYMGDDWNDYPVMQKVALKGCPADVCKDFKNKMDFVSQRNGGNGAVREFIEFILKEKGIYEKTLSAFFDYLAKH